MDVFKLDKMGNLDSLQDNNLGVSVRKTSQDLAYIEEQVKNAQRAIREGNSKVYNDAVDNIINIVEAMNSDDVKEKEKKKYNPHPPIPKGISKNAEDAIKDYYDKIKKSNVPSEVVKITVDALIKAYDGK
jgi:hypothetical protein